jgi:hypothetical protein
LLPTTQRGGKYQKRGVLYVAHGLWATRKARADLRLRMLLLPAVFRKKSLPKRVDAGWFSTPLPRAQRLVTTNHRGDTLWIGMNGSHATPTPSGARVVSRGGIVVRIGNQTTVVRACLFVGTHCISVEFARVAQSQWGVSFFTALKPKLEGIGLARAKNRLVSRPPLQQ